MSVFAITDRHIAGDSFVHRLDPRAKLVMTFVFIFAVLLTPQARWEIFAAMGTLLVVMTLASGLSPRLVIGRSLLALPFVLAAVPVIFNRPGEPLFEVPVFGWTATSEGAEALSSILLRSWLSVLAATLLTATTEPDHILRSLRWLGVPRILVATVSFMWRYIFVIGEEALRLIRAREARSARPNGKAGGSLLWRGQVAGHMVGSLFLRSLARSERVYVAMQARGYSGELKSMNRFALSRRDVIVVAVTLAAVIVIQTYARF
ncbi:MAG: cobalt ECF transporter T component CbiQ [Dehalococcoidia bacterium]|nr:cobalt ECF transporter T component CbiQ [Dehalococcoidia bacterium]